MLVLAVLAGIGYKRGWCARLASLNPAQACARKKAVSDADAQADDGSSGAKPTKPGLGASAKVPERLTNESPAGAPSSPSLSRSHLSLASLLGTRSKKLLVTSQPALAVDTSPYAVQLSPTASRATWSPSRNPLPSAVDEEAAMGELELGTPALHMAPSEASPASKSKGRRMRVDVHKGEEGDVGQGCGSGASTPVGKPQAPATPLSPALRSGGTPVSAAGDDSLPRRSRIGSVGFALESAAPASPTARPRAGASAALKPALVSLKEDTPPPGGKAASPSRIVLPPVGDGDTPTAVPVSPARRPVKSPSSIVRRKQSGLVVPTSPLGAQEASDASGSEEKRVRTPSAPSAGTGRA